MERCWVGMDMRDRRLGWVAERDTDLLLLEEFNSSPDFVEWWLAEVQHEGDTSHEFVHGWQSVAEADGESDVVVDVRCEKAGRLRLLIENKIGADAQLEQASRYTARGERYLRRGDCDEFIICIVAPLSFLDSDPEAKQYPHNISYEEVRDWFSQNSDSRARHKVSLLEEAIEQQTRGYQKRELPSVSGFMAFYRAVGESEFPSLGANPPPVGSSRGGWTYCRPAQLPRGWTLVHKMLSGTVDLTIPGGAARAADLAVRLRSLHANLEVTATRKSAICRLRVPSIDKEADAIVQQDLIRASLAAALELAHLTPEIHRIWADLANSE